VPGPPTESLGVAETEELTKKVFPVEKRPQGGVVWTVHVGKRRREVFASESRFFVNHMHPVFVGEQVHVLKVLLDVRAERRRQLLNRLAECVQIWFVLL